MLTLIQVTFHVIGPFATWDHIGKISPAIPSLEAVRRHMEKQVRTVYRGSSHTSPSHEKDVKTLGDAYVASRVHEFVPGHRIISKTALFMSKVLAGHTSNPASTLKPGM